MANAVPEVTPFRWDLAGKPLITKVTIDGVENVVALDAYLINDTTPRVIYVKLPSLFQDYVIRLQDLIDRVHDETFQASLFRDFDHEWNIQCTFWTMDGRQVSPEVLRNSRLGRALYGTRPEYYKSYRDQWVMCFNYAVRLAGIQKSESATTELVNRFYQPSSGKPFPLYFVPGKCIESFSRDNLKEALALASKNVSGIVPEWLPSHRITSDYIQLSVNPLGLYSTWVKRQDFARLVDDQTTGKHWIRVLPTTQQVVEFGKKLEAKPGAEGVLNFDALGTHSRSTLVQWPGQNLRSYENRTKPVVMAESADKWATDILKWHNKEGSVGAEWLNLVAHRFDESTSDRFTNKLFGTKECNTNMTRAEAAITQLLFSGKTYAVKLETEIMHALKHVRMLDVPELYSSTAEVSWLKAKLGEPKIHPYPDWIAPEFKYTVTSYLPTKHGYVEESSSTLFHPFSRQTPFRYEYELDKVILEMYLNLFEVPIGVDPIQAFKGIIRKDHLAPDAYYLDGAHDEKPNDQAGGQTSQEGTKEGTKEGAKEEGKKSGAPLPNGNPKETTAPIGGPAKEGKPISMSDIKAALMAGKAKPAVPIPARKHTWA
ncbi:hypothetical protein FRC07_006672 [Ceratobasidium sp. 392]|nr:hypothetical protein FRC07_006672 [Ceratobasidium sp. 392]